MSYAKSKLAEDMTLEELFDLVKQIARMHGRSFMDIDDVVMAHCAQAVRKAETPEERSRLIVEWYETTRKA